MRFLSSLRSRIFLSSALLAVLSIGVAIYLVSVRVTRELENELQREIVASSMVVDQLRTSRAQAFTMTARLIGDAPTLKAAVETDDPPTVQDIANGFQRQLNSNMLLVTNRSGAVLATLGVSPPTADLVAQQPTIREAITGRESVSLLPQPDAVLQVVTVPIAIGRTHPDILGTLSVGFLFDAALAGQLKSITGSDIAFGIDGQILTTTLAQGDRPALAALLGSGVHARNISLDSGEYVALPIKLSTDAMPAEAGRGPTALILRSRTDHLRFLRAIHAELTVTALVAVLLATLLSFTVARTITQPLAAITEVMRDVAATGDLTRKIVLRGGARWDDEDARLLATTFNTLTDSIARFQREMSQRERLSSLGRLSTVIAHEVRNPLMIIKAALHTLRQPTPEPRVVREAVADIDEEIARLNRIVNEVLDFARPIQFELATADLNALCRESATAAAAGPGAPVRLDLDPSMPPVTTDAERLRLALVNVIVNARQAVVQPHALAAVGARVFVAHETDVAPGSSDAEVTVSTRHSPDRAFVVVADAGRGIDAADLSRVFDPYFTTKRGGTGLGLPIAKNVVEGLGGAISVASVAGRGTEIRIELPLRAPVPSSR